MECKCMKGRYTTCEIHVPCDSGCKALVNPITLDEYKKALEHCQGHSLLHGCSHGC